MWRYITGLPQCSQQMKRRSVRNSMCDLARISTPSVSGRLNPGGGGSRTITSFQWQLGQTFVSTTSSIFMTTTPSGDQACVGGERSTHHFLESTGRTGHVLDLY